MAGVGFGFMYLPSIIMVSFYFDRKRALATGIAVCGSGVGTFVLAPFFNFLVSEYGWKVSRETAQWFVLFRDVPLMYERTWTHQYVVECGFINVHIFIHFRLNLCFLSWSWTTLTGSELTEHIKSQRLWAYVKFLLVKSFTNVIYAIDIFDLHACALLCYSSQ